MSEPGAAPRRPSAPSLALPALLAAAVGAVLVVLLGTQRLPLPLFALLHGALAIGAALGCARWTGDRAAAVLLGLGLLVMGPFGALGAALIALRDRFSRRDVRELGDWHRRLAGPRGPSAARALYEDIREGRAYRPSDLPERFEAVMRTGTVEERQVLLGVLVKEGVAPSSPLLAAALRSSDVAVRASAAAAVARLREAAAAHREVPG